MPATKVSVEAESRGVQEVAHDFAYFLEMFRQGEKDVKTLNKEMRQLSGSVYGARRAVMLARTQWRMMHVTWIEGARLMRDVGRIGRNITQMYQAYSIMQLRVSQASRTLNDSQNEFILRQDEVNRLVSHGVTTGEDYVNAVVAMNRASSQAKNAQSELAKAQQENIIGYVGIAMQISDIIATIPMFLMHIHMTRFAMQSSSIATGGAAAAQNVHTASLGKSILGHFGLTSAVTQKTIAEATSTTITKGSILATVGHTIATAAHTVKEWVLTAALWAKNTALAVAKALMGDLVSITLAVAAAAGIGSLAWTSYANATRDAGAAANEASDAFTGHSVMQSVQSTTRAVKAGQRAWEDYGRIMQRATTIYFSPIIYGEATTRTESYNEFIDTLRRQGII